MEFKKLEIHSPEWFAFANSHPDSNIFHHPEWIELLQRCYGYHPFIFALCDADGVIQAGLPVMEVNHPLRGRRWVSLPFSDHCMPLGSESDAALLLSELIRLQTQEAKPIPIEIRWNMPNQLSVQAPAKYVLHMLKMEPDLENVSSRIHHSHIRNVHIAQGHGIQIRHGIEQRDIEAFYTLHLETRHRQGVPIQPKQYFSMLGENIIRKGLGFISLAYQGSRCLAGAVFLHWNHTLTYKYGASTEEGLSFRPNHLVFWEAIHWGCEHGYSLLDFGRSDCGNAGLRLFKSRWGAREFPLVYTNLPLETRMSGQEGFLFSAIQTLIRKTPPWVCKLGGEFYYRMVA